MRFLNKLTDEDFAEFLKCIDCEFLDVPVPIIDCRNGKKNQFVILNCKPNVLDETTKNVRDLFIDKLEQSNNTYLAKLCNNAYDYCSYSIVVKEFSAFDSFKDYLDFSDKYFDFMCKKFPNDYAKAYNKASKAQKIKDKILNIFKNKNTKEDENTK